MRSFVLFFLVLTLALTTSAKAVLAVPSLTLTPAASSGLTVGTEFSVVIGVDSGTELSSAVDAWGTFDATKLEMVSATAVTGASAAFINDMSSKIDNVAGTFKLSFSSSSGTIEDKILKGGLATVVLRPKVAGTATLTFSCTAGSEADSNIYKSTGVDVINCATNQSGSYTIGAAATASTPTPTTATASTSSSSTSTSNSSTSTSTTATTLPQTGAVGATVGLMVFGAVSLISALFLKFL